tara:strand:- start:552 stop:1244 length:693 start_codon:yes stop_codon:yes gene_type:complete
MESKFIKKFNTKDFPFIDFFINHFKKINVNNLENLHNEISRDYISSELVSVENDQYQKIYSYLYTIDPSYDLKNKNKPKEFINCYKNFINFLSKNLFNEKLVYQSKPTLRVHYPDNLAVGGFHRDSEYNHPLEEINIWVPITAARDTASIWIESSYDKKDFSPNNLKFGEYLVFDSSLMHGNKKNEEGYTRISFDFRVIPISKWNNDIEEKASIANKIKFKIGDYYSISD